MSLEKLGNGNDAVDLCCVIMVILLLGNSVILGEGMGNGFWDSEGNEKVVALKLICACIM
jgi:hypothetical protein